MSTVDPAALATAATALLDSVVVSIEEHRDELVESFSAAVANAAPRECQGRSPEGEGCDRKPAHGGLCSWEFDQTVRRYRGFEEQAARVPALEAELARHAATIVALQERSRPERAKADAQV